MRCDFCRDEFPERIFPPRLTQSGEIICPECHIFLLSWPGRRGRRIAEFGYVVATLAFTLAAIAAIWGALGLIGLFLQWLLEKTA